MDGKTSIRVTVRLPMDLAEQMQEIADANKLPLRKAIVESCRAVARHMRDRKAKMETKA